MARYIDEDKLIEVLRADFDREGAKADNMAMRGLADVSVKYSHGQFCFLNAIEQVKITPTADVVPKSEVERLENTYRRAIRKIDNKTITAIRNAKTEVAREIFEEIEKKSSMWGGERHINLKRFAELKKKYMGDSQ